MTMISDERTGGPVAPTTGFTDDEAHALVVEALHAGGPSIAVQPILGLATGQVVSYEALSRFDHGGPSLTPDRWFRLAHRAGIGAMLEARAVDRALQLGEQRPPASLLSVNVSPSVLHSPELHDVLPFDLAGLQFEVTETEAVDDPERVSVVLEALRSRGARIAIDDVGEGYAGLQRVLAMSPDLLKLDRSLVTGVEHEPGKAAMIEAIVRYAAKVGAVVCAEGVETLEDLHVLADLDVAEAQGWAIGMPVPHFEAASEPARTTCVASFARALSVGGRGDSGGATPSMEHIVGRLSDAPDLDTLAQLMVLVADVVGCDRAELSIVDAHGEYLEAVRRDSWQPEGVRYSLAEYRASRRVLETQEMTQVLVGLPDADPHEVRWMLGEGIRSLMLVPVVSAGRPVGLLECCLVDEQPWARRQLRAARIVASVVGPVLDNLRSQRR